MTCVWGALGFIPPRFRRHGVASIPKPTIRALQLVECSPNLSAALRPCNCKWRLNPPAVEACHMRYLLRSRTSDPPPVRCVTIRSGAFIMYRRSSQVAPIGVLGDDTPSASAVIATPCRTEAPAQCCNPHRRSCTLSGIQVWS